MAIKNIFICFIFLFVLLPAFGCALSCEDINPKTGLDILSYISENHKLSEGRDVVMTTKHLRYCKDIEEKDYRFLLLINEQYESIGLLNCSVIKSGVRKECDKKLIETYLDGIILYLPAMKKGDSIEFSYEEDIKFPINKVWSTDDIYLESTAPIEQMDLTIEVPKTLDFQYYSSKQEPQISETTTSKVYAWHVKDVPYYEREPLMPPLRHSLSRVSFTSFKSWDEVEEWFEGLFKEVMKKQYVQNKASEIVRGATTDREKVVGMYNWVRDNISYQEYGFTFLSGYKPQELDDILRDEAADCKGQAALLVTMLDSVGIKAYPVVISYRDINRDVPGPYSFYHSIVYVPDVDGGMWLDPTCYYCPAGYIPIDEQDMYSLILLDGKKGFKPTLSLPPEKIAKTVVLESDVVSKDGSANIEGAVRMYEETAYVYQYIVKKKGMNSIKAILEEGMNEAMTKLCGEGKINNFTFDLGDGNTNLSFKSTCKRYATKSGDKLILNSQTDSSGSLSTFSEITAKDKRRFPILIPYEMIFDINGTIKLPPCYTIEELPPVKQVDESFITVGNNLSYNTDENAIESSSMIKFHPDEIAAENFSHFKEVISKITEPFSVIITPQESNIAKKAQGLENSINQSPAEPEVKGLWRDNLSLTQTLVSEGKCNQALKQLEALEETIKNYKTGKMGEGVSTTQPTIENKEVSTTQPTMAEKAGQTGQQTEESGGGQSCFPALPAVLISILSILVGVPYSLTKK